MNNNDDHGIHEEWTVVNRTSKRTSKRKVTPRRKYDPSGSNAKNLLVEPKLLLDDDNNSDDDNDNAVVSPDTVASHLAACSQLLTSSQFYNNFVQAWKAHYYFRRNLQQHDQQDDEYTSTQRMIDEIVCYGIGNFSQRLPPGSNNHNYYNHNYNNYSGPLWQLALALEMQQMASSLKQPQQQQQEEQSIRMVYFDPLVTSVESQVLQDHYKVVVLDQNERGLRKSTHTINNLSINDTTIKTPTASAPTTASAKSVMTTTTLFFMPHCPKGLYENVLWANWHSLQQDPQSIGIIGNSLVTYVERATTTTTTTTSSTTTTTTTTTSSRLPTTTNVTNNSKNKRDNNHNHKTEKKSCLELIQPFVREQLIGYTRRDIRDMPGQFEAAFNDMYLTTFCHHPEENNQNNDSCYRKQMWPERPQQPSDDGQNEVL